MSNGTRDARYTAVQQQNHVPYEYCDCCNLGTSTRLLVRQSSDVSYEHIRYDTYHTYDLNDIYDTWSKRNVLRRFFAPSSPAGS